MQIAKVKMKNGWKGSHSVSSGKTRLEVKVLSQSFQSTGKAGAFRFEPQGE
jgi:hypothetical protein